MLNIDNPTNLPPVGEIAKMEEPYVHAELFTPQEYVGTLMDLCQDKRGTFIDMQYEGSRVKLNYDIPLNEIIFDFFDQVKSRSRGYASLTMSSRITGESDLVKLDILLNGDICDAFSIIVHRDKAYARGRSIAEKLKEVIPRQMFEIPIQAAIGGKVIARETVKAMRKDVLAKCYGGDITRKKKLLESRRKARSVCASLVLYRCPARPSWRYSKWTRTKLQWRSRGGESAVPQREQCVCFTGHRELEEAELPGLRQALELTLEAAWAQDTATSTMAVPWALT